MQSEKFSYIVIKLLLVTVFVVADIIVPMVVTDIQKYFKASPLRRITIYNEICIQDMHYGLELRDLCSLSNLL